MVLKSQLKKLKILRPKQLYNSTHVFVKQINIIFHEINLKKKLKVKPTKKILELKNLRLSLSLQLFDHIKLFKKLKKIKKETIATAAKNNKLKKTPLKQLKLMQQSQTNQLQKKKKDQRSKQDMSNIICSNYNKKNHYANSYSKPVKNQLQSWQSFYQ